jgi:hypothetical protein
MLKEETERPQQYKHANLIQSSALAEDSSLRKSHLPNEYQKTENKKGGKVVFIVFYSLWLFSQH